VVVVCVQVTSRKLGSVTSTWGLKILRQTKKHAKTKYEEEKQFKKKKTKKKKKKTVPVEDRQEKRSLGRREVSFCFSRGKQKSGLRK